jgi:hypothetical protein
MPEDYQEEPHDLALSALEAVEYRSLSWGYVDGSLSEREAEGAISAALGETGTKVDPGRVLDDLVDAKLVRVWRSGERRYRTRFAELVRLLVRSRQLFPGRPWRTAPPLVSDFRLDIRPRATPRPDTDPAMALEEVGAEAGLSALQRAVWQALTQADQQFRLRRFQVEAARRLLVTQGEHGTIVTAGTGSGKTLAFYLPAIVAVSETLLPGDHWTRALCIYPRQELLKDQFSETHRLGLRAGDTLAAAGRRPIAIGALYAGTPLASDVGALANAKWKRTPAGYLCPFIRCPLCAAEMVWAHPDVALHNECLRCTRAGCTGTTTPDTVRLTRQSIRQAPPDFLFTTTEMLNQRLSDTAHRHLFGVGRPRAKRPFLLLLDEVHTYSGASGAQAALLLRRCRYLIDAPLRWVGLSATLREAASFFSDLTGLRPDEVAEVTPAPDDMRYSGAEYQLILRTDPASQAATLSTSIQAAMLVGRMLDPTVPGPSLGRFGRRLFAFTDDLDVTHRLFDDLRDAEAYNRFGRADGGRLPLAALRSGNQPDLDAREADGQRWALAEELRGTLDGRLVVSRTTSRDPGVDGRADVIVATAALEVGFNDTEVGAILQHKAPRSFAAFLQRRGRAGRRTGMRPLTVTVLSDYGRDRIAFQAFEHLLDPTIERQALPVRNTYVLRMQATYAMLDWLAARVADDGGHGWAWRTLSQPPFPDGRDAVFRQKAKSVVQAIARLDGAVVADLSAYLRGALQLTDAEVRSVLWEPPRSLLLEAVPTLARRLFRDWRLADGAGLDLMVEHHPLPDFIPRTLFEDLNLPEVRIDVPPPSIRQRFASPQDADQPKVEPMPVLQALSQFAPGRVRRRFADEYAGLAHWVPIPSDQAEASISVDAYAPEREFVGRFPGRAAGVDCMLRVYRPWRMQVEETPAGVLATSHGSWHWQSGFEFLGDPVAVELPPRCPWWATVRKLEFFLHRFGAAISQRRFASEGAAEIRKRRESAHVMFRVRDQDGEPAAVGFAFEADALLVPFYLAEASVLATRELGAGLTHWLRTLRLRRAVACDALMPEDVNAFQRDWLYQALILAVARRAEVDGTGFAEAADAIAAAGDPSALRTALAAIVSAEVLDEEDPDDGSRLAEALREVLSRPGVVAGLGRIAAEVARMSGKLWGDWLAEVLRNTMAEAVLQACHVASPANTSIEGLMVDLVERDGTATVLVAEATLGGGGTVEALAHGFAAEPRAFTKALDAALAPSDLEAAATSLERVVRLAVGDTSVREAIATLRTAASPDARGAARDALFGLLSRRGVNVSRALSVSIATRLLRPGASAETDALTVDLLDRWTTAEDRCGVAFPVRVAAALCAVDPALGARLRSVGEAGSEIGTANLLLWPRGGELRLGALQSYNPYRAAALTDALLARRILIEGRVPIVALDDPDWEALVREALSAVGEVHLKATSDDVGRLRGEITRLLGSPVDAAYLRLFPCLDGLHREANGSMVAEFSIRERT